MLAESALYRALRFSSLFSLSAAAGVASGAAVTAAALAPVPSARRKSRRPNFVLGSDFIASPPCVKPALLGERESFRLDIHQQPSNRSDRTIEVCGLGVFEV